MLIPVQPALKKNGDPAEQALGRSRGGFSTKIHATVDGLGNPLRLCLTAGQRHDIMQAPTLIEGLDFDYLLADRAYGAQDFIDLLLKCEIEPVIPPKKNATAARLR